MSSEIPADRAYTEAHEWVQTTGDGVVRIGVTDHAQRELGEVVLVALPEVGVSFSAGDPLGEVESTKAFSDIFAPLGGEIVTVNEALADNPGLVNSAPYGDGWIAELRLADAGGSPLDALLDAEAYEQLTDGS